MPQFFINEKDISGENILLTGENHHHLSKVRRVKKGDNLMVRTEKGTVYDVKVIEAGADSIITKIIDSFVPEVDDLKLTLCLALLKGSSFDTVIQKSVEVGVSRIIPIISERTVPDISKKIESKLQRWEKIVLEASKQCMRKSIPEVAYPCHLKDMLVNNIAGEKIIAQPSCEKSFKDYASSRNGVSDVSLLIGPEGGFSDNELTMAEKSEWSQLSFGENHFRAETAAVVIPSIIIYQWS